MGYCYGPTASGRMALACDNCGTVGGVRKRTCPHTVLWDSLRSADGRRHPVHYCPAPALCGGCYTKLRPTLHADCEQAAAASTAEHDAIEQRLRSGDKAVVVATTEGCPPGMVRVKFSGPGYTSHEELVMPKADYDWVGKPWLSDYLHVGTHVG